jgi:hypothetical protein
MHQKSTFSASSWARKRATLLCVAYFVNNALPYVGLRFEGCQTMFSGLITLGRSNNHWFMPQLFDGSPDDYISDLQVKIAPQPLREDDLRLLSWMRRGPVRHNFEAVKWAVWRLCRRLTLQGVQFREGQTTVMSIAPCTDVPHPNFALPFRLYPPLLGPMNPADSR